MNNESNYPKEVELFLSEATVAVQLLNLGQKTPAHCIREVLGPIIFEQWMQGEITGFTDEEQMVQLLQRIVVVSVLDALKNEGLIDSVDGEHGDEMVFLTSKGKELATDMIAITKESLTNAQK